MEKTKSTKPKSASRKNTIIKKKKEEKKKSVDAKKIDYQYIEQLNSMWKKNYKYIELQAIISKAKIDRTIEDLIDNKVNAEFNSMLYQIKKLNGRYGEKNRSYATIKDELITLLKKYEKKLYEIINNDVEELDNLFIEMATLQYKKLNTIIENAILIMEDKNNSIQKKIAQRISDSMKNLMALITNKTLDKEAYIDVSLYNKMADEIGIQNEIDKKIILKVNSKNEKYLIDVEEITIEIKKVEKKIEKINKKINQLILDSMESEEKSLSTDIKPKFKEKVSLFFLSKFNMPYLVRKRVLQPFEERILNYKG